MAIDLSGCRLARWACSRISATRQGYESELIAVVAKGLWRDDSLFIDPLFSGFKGLFGSQALLLFLFLVLVVMPLDSEEHAGAEHDGFERHEDDRYPIHDF